MKIIHKTTHPEHGMGGYIQYEDGTWLGIESHSTGEVNYFWDGGSCLVWRNRGGGWTFAGNSERVRYPCRLAAVVAFRLEKT